ncbi:hypothetical protein J4437_06125 [Candidatus Woesearchaeota archaeon]|nr:hypothetical protein [Candidatus Woesearchaeota archaeon]
MHPGGWEAVAQVFAGNSIFTSDAKEFDILTPASPVNSHNSGNVQFTNGVSQEIDAPSVKTKLNILTNADANGTVEVDEYSTNPTSNANFGVLALGRFIAIEADSSIDDALTQAVINVSYTQGEVNSAGIDESTLRLYFYNGTSNTWVPFNPPNGGVNTDQNYIWAVTSHFSIWGLFGGSEPAPSPAPSSGGGGGGSSGSIFSWQCSAWSECAPAGTQTRTCDLVPGSGGATTKPAETQTCTYAAPQQSTELSEPQSQQIQQKQSGQPAKEQPPIPTGAATAGQKKGLGGITGRAISTLTKPSGIAAIIVSILVLGGGYTAYYYLYKKKR